MLQNIISKLDKVKKTKNGWVACCPVHNDKTPSMHIKLAGDVILMHCMSCQANGSDVCRELGLSMSELWEKPAQRIEGYIPQRIKDQSIEDVFFIDLYEQARREGKQETLEEYRRYKLALQRSKHAENPGYRQNQTHQNSKPRGASIRAQ